MSTAAPHSQPVSAHNAPIPKPEELPDDVATLRHMIVELATTLHQRDHDLEETRQRIHLLLRRLYGRKSERFDPNQPLLFADDVPGQDDATVEPEPAAAEADSPERKRRGRPHGRRRLPEDLPRRPLDHVLGDAQRICVCGHTRVDIGTDVSEQLDWQPASYFVWQHRIHKYLCPFCAGQPTPEGAATEAAPTEPTPPDPTPTTPVFSAPAETPPPAPEVPAAMADAPRAIGPAIIAAPKPPMPIDKGMPGPGLLAHIIVSKYFDHLPLYRQENISQRQGVLIPRSTSCDWMAACAELLRPLYALMVTRILQSQWLHTDDTPVKNLGHDPGTTPTARFWI